MNVRIGEMSPTSGPRPVLFLLIGALGLLLPTATVWSESDGGSRCVLSGCVLGLAEDAGARVEVRRLGDLWGQGALG